MNEKKKAEQKKSTSTEHDGNFYPSYEGRKEKRQGKNSSTKNETIVSGRIALVPAKRRRSWSFVRVTVGAIKSNRPHLLFP